MRLSYRGAVYHHEPTSIDRVDSGISGQYRGQTCNFAYPRHIPVPQAAVALNYRGVSYQTIETGDIASAPATHPELISGEQAVVVRLPLRSYARRLQTSEITAVHLENIRQRLQHRLDVAKASGDTNLLHELEKEMHLFA